MALQRIGEKPDNAVHELGHADILGRAAAKNRNRLAVAHRRHQPRGDFLIRQFLAIEVAHHQLFIGLGDHVEPQSAAFGHRSGNLRRNVLFEQHIDHPAEAAFAADRIV
ncbi:hypothetical protein SDC9_130683 [bioreactor metagenome]|uniref:Uncharacterized protein n=1 Tax=bioreactor metagenome TaxID=1076179 RepID=A0A645D2U3_9ZZZZ